MRRLSATVVLFLALATGGLSGADNLPGAMDDAPAPEPSIGVQDFFRAGELSNPVISPDGQVVAYLARGRIFVGNTLAGYGPLTRELWRHELLDLDWISNHELLLHRRARDSGALSFVAFELAREGEGYRIERENELAIHGYLFDAMPQSPGRVLIAAYVLEDGRTSADLFYIDVYGSAYQQTKSRRRLNDRTRHLLHYVRGQELSLHFGVTYNERRPEIWQRDGDRRAWELTWTGPQASSFLPISVSADGSVVWALSDAVTDKVAAVAFDVAGASISQVLYEHDRADLNGIIMSPDGTTPIGVTFMDRGLIRFEALTPEAERLYDFARAEFPDSDVAIIDMSADQAAQLVAVSDSGNPGAVYRCDRTARECDLVSPLYPWLEDIGLAPVRAETLTTDDGFELDLFLTLPNDVAGPESVPVIVMPHGGPIGVSDNRYFSGDVQWLAWNGYAVLQVNYRGSGGYGREFRSAGLREWGRGIEDDIETALDHVLRSEDVLDAGRVCTFGASYGGYSALMSVIDRPERYRCAASFAGVTDLTLLFNGSRFRHNMRLRDRLIEMIGDPDVDMPELMEYSPVYQYQRLSRPVYLAHGNKDRVVDVEHSWRLRKMLALADSPVELHVLDDVGHGFALTDQVEAFYAPLMDFFALHLQGVGASQNATVETGDGPTGGSRAASN